MNIRLSIHGSAWKVCLGLAVATVLLGWSTAQACTTPVYRYAMYNWAVSPYYVFHFHRGEPSEEDEQINQMIAELARATPAAGNVRLESVDLDGEDLEKLPEPVKEAFNSHQQGEPTHLVFTSWGVKLFSGRLDSAEVDAMVHSPGRTRLAELLDEGNATVLLFVPGADGQENAQAEEAVKELIARAAAGGIPVSIPPPMPPLPPGEDPGAAPLDEDQIAEASRINVALLKVDRSDPAERWLIRSLMSIEPDLNELADQPMVFAVYGRARALEPYVGKGITADNLTEVVAFVADACSCMVKEMNPGMDLLVEWDWEATAEKMAQTDPSLNLGLYGYQEFDPASMAEPVPQAEPQPAPGPQIAEQRSPSASASSAEQGAPASPETETVAVAKTPRPEPAGSPKSTEQAPTGSGTVASAGPGPQPPASRTRIIFEYSFAGRQIWMYGIGLAVAAVLVLGAGFVFIRRRSV